MEVKANTLLRLVFTSLIIFCLFHVGTVDSYELAIMDHRCLPCTGYNYDYCMDDPNLVNLNGNKCYTKREDKQEFCANFTFLHNPLICNTVNLTESKACD